MDLKPLAEQKSDFHEFMSGKVRQKNKSLIFTIPSILGIISVLDNWRTGF